MTGIEDVFNPTDIDIYRDLAGGVTTANVLHGSANPIGGKNLVIKLRWGKVPDRRVPLCRAPCRASSSPWARTERRAAVRQQGPRRYPTAAWAWSS